MKRLYIILLLILWGCSFTFAQKTNTKFKAYHTYSQGFFGTHGSKACDDTKMEDFIYNLLQEDLVIGGGSNTLTISKDEIDHLIGRLPGGGPSKELNGQATCAKPVGIQTNKGRFKNSLLAQTITLGLNLRADELLGELRLESRKFKTWKSKDCSDPLSGKKGKAYAYYLSETVLEQLGENNTVNDLYALANTALAAEDIGSLEIWQITSAVTVINHAFKEGAVLKGFYGNEKDSKVNFGDQEMFVMRVFPNPMRTNGKIEFTTLETGRTTIELYSMTGSRIDTFMDENVEEFTPLSVEIDVRKYKKGMYILYIRNGLNVVKEKITVVK